MFDASSLLGGMLGGGFGRQRQQSSGSGVLGTVATVGGLAAVGGLGYMAYKHFTGPQQAAAQPGWGAQPGGPPMGGGPMGPPMGGGAPGAPWGGAPGAAQGQAQGGIGGMLKGLVGDSGGMQTQGFGSMPGYEYQSGNFGAAPPMGPPSWATNPNAPIAQPHGGAYAPAPATPAPAAQGYAPPPAPTVPGAPVNAALAPAPGAPVSPTGGYVEPPPPPIFDASGVVTSHAASGASATAAPGTPTAVAAAPASAPDAAAQKGAMLLVRAMVAAAAADGVIDDKERADILGRLAATGVGPEEQAELAKELEHPRPVASLVAEVEGAEMAKQFYAVSLLAISVDNNAEKLHMRAIAGMLGLSSDDVAKIHGELGVPPLG